MTIQTQKDAQGDIVRHKAKLVVKGYSQRYGIDYEEVFAPMVWFESILVLLAIVIEKGGDLHHLDVKVAFLNGDVEEELYVK